MLHACCSLPLALPLDPLDLGLVTDVGDGLLDQVDGIHLAGLVPTPAHSTTASLSCSHFCFQSCSATFSKSRLGSSLATNPG